MKGLDVKNKLKKNGYIIKEIATLMGETPQNLNSMLNAEDIKTGVLERIAKAINKNLYFFFNDNSNDNSAVSLETLLVQAGRPAVIKSLEKAGRKLGSSAEYDNQQGHSTTISENRLWALIESQQRQIESQQKIIENLSKMGNEAVEDAPGVARKAAQG